MKFKYPSGSLSAKQPNLSINLKNRETIYSNRGMSLEEELNLSNKFYLEHDIAVIHKKPTPIQIVKVDYPKRSAAIIKEAYFSKASTTDYNGIFKGRYIDFDAKETKNTTSFPLNNFHAHQIKHLRKCQKLGGICFTIVKFVKLEKIFLLSASILFQYWDNMQNNGRKSIPLKVFEQQGIAIDYQINPLIPYLDAVNQLITD